MKDSQGHHNGPAVSNVKGKILSTQSVNDCFLEALENVYEAKQDLFPAKIQTLGDIKLCYHIYRSPRRTSDTRALEKNVSSTDIDIVNRWKKVEKADGKKIVGEMKHYYADVTLLMGPFKRYTSAM